MAQEGLSALQIAASTWVPVEEFGCEGRSSPEPLQAGAGWADLPNSSLGSAPTRACAWLTVVPGPRNDKLV